MRRSLSLALAAACLPGALAAQGLGDASFRAAPQYIGYTLDQAGTKVKVSELSVPLAYVLPLSSRLTFDVGTAFANAHVDAGGGQTSTISGLTDTQVRFNLTLGSDAVVVTAGLNVPSGQYNVAGDKVAAAGQIGNDFLAFPISSFGNGFAGTGGIAVAKALGAWNIGIGGSFRKSTEFGAFKADTNALRFQPADEARVRFGVDRAALGGRIVLGVIYSMFGNDQTVDAGARSTYSTGDRMIGQAAFEAPVGSAEFYLGGWVLHHAAGQNVAGDAPAENIINGTLSLGFNLGSLYLEPNVEGRNWTVDGSKAGSLGYVGVRTRFDMGSLEISPSVAYGMGTLNGATNTDIKGLKGGLVIRIGQ